MDANWNVRSITFDSGASAFTLISIAGGGKTLTLQAGITNDSTALQTINITTVLGAAQTWNAASGNLSFGGTVAKRGFSSDD